MKELKNKVCLITGGAGVIGSSLVQGLASAGLRCVILDLNGKAATELARNTEKTTGSPCLGLEVNVLDRSSLLAAREEILAGTGDFDFLINAAGGNHPMATTAVESIGEGELKDLSSSFFGLETEGFRKVFDLNFTGTLLPTLVFGETLVRRGKGSIINVSSMNSFRPLTRIPAYSAAKASINNFTQWLAVHFAPAGVRVNAIAPGFFLTHQNKFLLVDEKTGKPTPRGEKIIRSTPMGRYGKPGEITGTVLFLLSDLSAFITGTIIPIDGGYNAYSGV